jgi:hypothetical protein
MREFEAIFERKVEDFLALYPSYIEQVKEPTCTGGLICN